MVVWFIVDEGSSISISLEYYWKGVGSRNLVLAIYHPLHFGKRTRENLGFVPQFHTTLDGKSVPVIFMVMEDPLDSYMLLGNDYVYSMNDVVFTKFCVMNFPHNQSIITIF